MIEIKVDIRGFKKQMSQVQNVISRGARNGFQNGLEVIVQEVKKNIPVATGKAKASIRAVVSKNKSGLRGTVTAIGAAKSYVTYIEHGRTPGGFPPISKIQRWLQITTRGRRFVDAIAVAYNLNEEQALQAATFLKSRAIARYGTRGTKVFSRALAKHLKKIAPAIDREIKKELRKVNGL